MELLSCYRRASASSARKRCPSRVFCIRTGRHINAASSQRQSQGSKQPKTPLRDITSYTTHATRRHPTDFMRNCSSIDRCCHSPSVRSICLTNAKYFFWEKNSPSCTVQSLVCEFSNRVRYALARCPNKATSTIYNLLLLRQNWDGFWSSITIS